MLNKIAQLFKVKELRNKVLFVLLIFVIFRMMSNLLIPGIPKEGMQAIYKSMVSGNSAGNLNQGFQLLNVFSGGALDHFSVIMLGLGPYITATIILQLLGIVIPALGELQKEGGERGKKIIEQYARFFTVILAFFNAFGMLLYFQNAGVGAGGKLFGEGIGPMSLPFLASVIVVMAGSMVVMWLGELISEKGIGDGVSLLIFAGILSRMPVGVGGVLKLAAGGAISVINIILFVILSIVIIGCVVLINESKRNIAISYAKQVRGNRVFGGVTTYLPLSVNPTGVIPIIFALSFLVIPSSIAQMLTGIPAIQANAALTTGLTNFSNFFDIRINPLGHNLIYFAMIFLFTYFYAAVVFNPKEMADNFQKSGGFIPGIRPGENTAQYLDYVLSRLLFIGALFLSFVALTPSLIDSALNIQGLDFLIGGTSLLIVVSVILETVRKINAQLQMRDYDSI